MAITWLRVSDKDRSVRDGGVNNRLSPDSLRCVCKPARCEIEANLWDSSVSFIATEQGTSTDLAIVDVDALEGPTWVVG